MSRRRAPVGVTWNFREPHFYTNKQKEASVSLKAVFVLQVWGVISPFKKNAENDGSSPLLNELSPRGTLFI